MRMSKMLLRTLREPPSEAELASHRLLLRAGLAAPLAAGLYCFTPLGWRVIRRIEAVIREEMDASGAQEVHLPALHPIELWEQSGRAETMGQTLFRLSDRRERRFALGPTHEEVMSFLAGSEHPELPRPAGDALPDPDEVPGRTQATRRPRPSPRVHDEGRLQLRYRAGTALDASYDAAFAAYDRIFARAGVPVDAGGSRFGRHRREGQPGVRLPDRRR